MDRFYQKLLGKRDALEKPMPKAEAPAEAEKWLRTFSSAEALKLTATLTNGVSRGDRREVKLRPVAQQPKNANPPKDDKPLANPEYWAVFILIGDPN